MANENVVVTDPFLVLKKIEKDLADRDVRIKELESTLETANEKSVTLKKKVDKLTQAIETKAKESSEPSSPVDGVVLHGTHYDIIGTFRADNTFADVKRGYCPEGVTLVAINRPG